MAYCANPECDDGRGFPRETLYGRTHCERCGRRVRRGKSLTDPFVERLPPRTDFVENCIALAEFDDETQADAAFEKSVDRALHKAERALYEEAGFWRRLKEPLVQRGWTPPEGLNRVGRSRRVRKLVVALAQLELPIGMEAA